jgi:hypothetical protein
MKDGLPLSLHDLRAKLAEMSALADAGVAKANAVVVGKGLPITDEDVRRLASAASNPDAPESLRRLAIRVDQGDFTWRQIAEGEAFTDPGVVAAYADAGGQVDGTELTRIAGMLAEGFTPEEVVESAAPQAQGGEESTGTRFLRSTW